MAEGSYRMESETYNVEDMDEGSDEVGEEDMVEGNDYEEFGAFGGYGTLTSFDIRILRAFGSLGPGLRILSVRPLVDHLLALGLLPCEAAVERGGERWVKGRAEWGRTAQLPQASLSYSEEGGLGRSGGGGSWLQGGGWPAQGSMMGACRAVCLPLPFSLALQNEPWELENPMLARTLMEAFQLDPETLANEAAARAANVARAAASNRAARAAAAAARATYNQVVTNCPVATDQASGEDTQPMTYAAQAPAATPETTRAAPHISQMLVNSEMAAPGAPATSPQPQTASQAQEAATEGPSTACAFAQAPCASEMEATRPKTAFLGQNDVFDFTQPAGVSGMAFPRPKRPAPPQEAAPEGPSAASSGVAQAAPAREGAATRPKTTKSGKALAKTRWVEPQNVVAAAATKAKMAPSIPEPEGAAATAQHSAEPWVRMGGKRTKKVRPPCSLQPPLAPLLSLLSPLLCPLLPLPPPPPSSPSSPRLSSPLLPPSPLPSLLSACACLSNTNAIACFGCTKFLSSGLEGEEVGSVPGA